MATSTYGPDRGGIINVKVDSRGFRIPKGQPGAGQFTDEQSEFTSRNRRQARETQAFLVNMIEGRIKREAVSTGRLIKATGDTGNVHADQFGWHLGIESHLNKSTAKYWRTIEEGSAIVWPDVGGGRPSMIGLELKGFFGGSIIGMTDGGRRALAGPPFSKPTRKAPQTGKFMPSNAKRAGRGIVRREVAPMFAYRDTFKELDVGGVAFRNFELYLLHVTQAEGFPIISKGSSKYF